MYAIIVWLYTTVLKALDYIAVWDVSQWLSCSLIWGQFGLITIIVLFSFFINLCATAGITKLCVIIHNCLLYSQWQQLVLCLIMPNKCDIIVLNMLN